MAVPDHDQSTAATASGQIRRLEGIAPVNRLAHAVVGRCAAFPVERSALLQPLLWGDASDHADAPIGVRDYAEWTGEVALRSLSSRPRAKGPTSKGLTEIMEGEVGLDEDGEAAFQIAGGPALGLDSSASMVRALAPLALYLRYLGAPGDLLLIDEPEMNAHPSAQLAICELIGLLVREGYRIVVTTHSPYLLDHLNNLMAGSALEEDERRAAIKKLRLRRDAFLSPEQVAVHEFRVHGKGVVVEDVLDRETPEVTTDTFGKWSDRVFNLSSELQHR